uniref:B-box and SPRY domain containing n=1 Tax=Sinocyclocheilus anshuiensis TaxID=1608454 RepID=A0A671SY45_9TELE
MLQEQSSPKFNKSFFFFLKKNLISDLRTLQPLYKHFRVIHLRQKSENHVGSGADSISASVEAKLCPVHERELQLYCSTEGRLTCSKCVSDGSCQGHTVTELVTRATVVKVSDSQLGFNFRYVSNVTPQEEETFARERVLAQVNVVRDALEEEEQRLLEAIQREEERVEQCLLTQRAHWTHTLEKLTHTRTSLVHTLTHSTDTMIVVMYCNILKHWHSTSLTFNFKFSCSEHLLNISFLSLAHRLTTLHFEAQTVSPLLSLSNDQCTLTFLPKRQRQSPPYDLARFDTWPNALCSPAMSSGTHSWVLDVGTSAAFKVGVCYSSIERKGSGNAARLGYNTKSWVLSHYEGDLSFCHDGCNVGITVAKKLKQVGLLLDWPSQTLLFYDPESMSVLHVVRHAFSEPLLAACAVADQSVSIVH